MLLMHDYLFAAMWLGYLAYWWGKSTHVKTTERSEPSLSRFGRLALMLSAVALLSLPTVPLPLLRERFLPPGAGCFWTGAAVTAVGLFFSVWGRRYLGRNWSQAVTVKKDHELTTSGPYALVRHPIYTGLLMAFVGSAIARGEWRGVLAVGLIFVALWHKLGLEEKWMRARFGERYEAYSRRVAALVPYIL